MADIVPMNIRHPEYPDYAYYPEQAPILGIEPPPRERLINGSSVDPEAESSPTVGFYYPLLAILAVWSLIIGFYLVFKCKQKTKGQYVVPRVYVLCSPRNVQFHYELILRVGLPTNDYNPDRHNLDMTVSGLQRNEAVPLTRLSTKTLADDPLITNLSMIVHRLVEMPPLGTLTLRHSGPFRAAVYVYDFTVVDLSTNSEQYYTVQRYVGSLNKVYRLGGPHDHVNTRYPIEDVPMPHVTADDIFLTLGASINYAILTLAYLPLNCTMLSNILVALLAIFHGSSMACLLDWLLYYKLRWHQARREYFNMPETSIKEGAWRSIVAVFVAGLGICAGVISVLTVRQQFFAWLVVTVAVSVALPFIWYVARRLHLAESLISFGLKCRRIESVPVSAEPQDRGRGMHDAKSNSTSDDSGHGSALSHHGHRPHSIGPRSSVKSFGFDTTVAGPGGSKRSLSQLISSGGASATGATPNAQLKPSELQPMVRPRPVSAMIGHAAKAEKSKSTSEKRRAAAAKASAAVAAAAVAPSGQPTASQELVPGAKEASARKKIKTHDKEPSTNKKDNSKGKDKTLNAKK